MPRTVVFGAFDRHNLGDLLAAHSARLAELCREGCAQWIEWLG